MTPSHRMTLKDLNDIDRTRQFATASIEDAMTTVFEYGRTIEWTAGGHRQQGLEVAVSPFERVKVYNTSTHRTVWVPLAHILDAYRGVPDILGPSEADHLP